MLILSANHVDIIHAVYFLQVLAPKLSMHFALSNACYILSQFHPPWRDLNNNFRAVQIMELLLIQIKTAFPYFVTKSKRCRHRPLLEHHRSVFSSQCDQGSPIQSTLNISPRTTRNEEMGETVMLQFRYMPFRCALLATLDHYPQAWIFIYYRQKFILERLKLTDTTLQESVYRTVKSSPASSSVQDKLKWMWRRCHGWPWYWVAEKLAFSSNLVRLVTRQDLVNLFATIGHILYYKSYF